MFLLKFISLPIVLFFILCIVGCLLTIWLIDGTYNHKAAMSIFSDQTKWLAKF